MPSIASLEGLERAAAEFEVSDLALVIEPPALAAVRRSLDESGLLLLGEVHGVRENPLVIRALMLALGLDGLALEWPDELAPVIGAFAAGGALADHPALWMGDGRITAGHLAVLRERAAAGRLALCLFDGPVFDGPVFDDPAGTDWSWSRRDEAMASRLLAGATAASGTLAVAGNAHTPTEPADLGVPLGARVSRQRPGVRDIRIDYGGGRFYNIGPRRFAPRTSRGPILLRERDGSLILDLPAASEALVPQRPWPGQA
jgi:hypothetical protein